MSNGMQQPRPLNPTRRTLERVIKSHPIAFHPDIARVSGGATAGLLLCQLLYWAGIVEDTKPEQDGWFYKTRDELVTETTLSRREQETARRHLRSLGYIQERRRGLPLKLWFRVNVDAVCRDLAKDWPHPSGTKAPR